MLAEKIGKYELVERLASGSMGTVYSAHDPFTNRLVAIKVAHPQFAEQTANARKFRKLFFNEAHAAGMLDHPNILRVFDADMDGSISALDARFLAQVNFGLLRFIKAVSVFPALDPRAGGLLNINVTLQGKNMDMGLISAPLLDIGHGFFAGDTSLPMCVRDSMIWTATVISNSPRGRYRAGFEFVMLSR